MKKIISIVIIVGGWYLNKNGWPDFLQTSRNTVTTNTSMPSTPPAAPLTF